MTWTSLVALGQRHPLISSIVVVAVVLLLGRWAAWAALRALGRWARRTETPIDDLVAKHLTRPIRWLVPAVALTLAMPLVTLPPGPHATLKHAALAASIVFTGWILVAAVRVAEGVVTERLDLGIEDNLRARTVATQLRGLRNIVVFALVVLTAGAVLLTFDAVRQVGGALLASAGVAGLVVGFAAQRSLAAVLAGIQIAVTQPIRLDDVLVVEGEWGRVEEITLTYVVVRIWDQRRLILPIGYFIDKPFQNWTRVSAELLGTVELHLDYGVPVDELRQELGRVLDASAEWDRRASNLQVTAAGERTMTVRALFSAKTSSDAWDLRCKVRERLIAFVHARFPHALPRARTELTEQSIATIRRLGPSPSPHADRPSLPRDH